jgi:hypothetical protein
MDLLIGSIVGSLILQMLGILYLLVLTRSLYVFAKNKSLNLIYFLKNARRSEVA